MSQYYFAFGCRLKNELVTFLMKKVIMVEIC